MSERRNPRIASVGKAFALLTEIAERTEPPTVKELSAAIGAPLPTAYHMLNTLVAEGAVVKAARGYLLGPRIGVLADAYLEQGEPVARLEGPLKELAARTGETAYLSVWRKGEIEVITTAEGTHAVRGALLPRGTHGSAHARASGKLLLALARPGLLEQYLGDHPLEPRTAHTICDPDALRAEFELIRERGYATDIEEFAQDLSCIAAPVFSAGHVLGAYTVSSPSVRFQRVEKELVATLLEVCRQAEELVAEQS